MNTSVLMPVFAVIFCMVIIVAVIFAVVRMKTAQMQAIGQRSFSDLADELRKDQRDIKASLDTLTVKVTSIEKMMKDVE